MFSQIDFEVSVQFSKYIPTMSYISAFTAIQIPDFVSKSNFAIWTSSRMNENK